MEETKTRTLKYSIILCRVFDCFSRAVAAASLMLHPSCSLSITHQNVTSRPFQIKVTVIIIPKIILLLLTQDVSYALLIYVPELPHRQRHFENL